MRVDLLHRLKKEFTEDFKLIIKVSNHLRKAGFEAYIVGGAVRDLVLNRHPKDFDLATNATPEQIQKVKGLEKAVYPDTAQAYGVTRLKIDGSELEIATFRKDIDPHLGRKQTKVEFVTLDEDLLRRDFTVNALAIDPISGKLVDHVGGLEDIKSELIRFIGDPNARIQEDPLRLLRAIRFKNSLDFEYEDETTQAIIDAVKNGMVNDIATDRLRIELSRMLVHQSRVNALKDLDKFGILKLVLPEVTAGKGVEQPPQFHAEGDVWTHQLLAMDALPPYPSRQLAWATLLHDIGKPATLSLPKNKSDRIHFDKHYSIGADMAKQILSRLKFSKKEIENIMWMIHYHLSIDDLPNMTRSHQIKMLSHPAFSDLFELHKADATASWSKGRRQQTPDFPVLEELWQDYQSKSPEERVPSLKRDLGIDGNWLLKEFGKEFDLKSNARLGELLKQLEEIYKNQGISDKKYYRDKAKQLLDASFKLKS